MTQSDAAMLGIHDADAHDLRVVVISHDCDLANDKEEQAELIVARLVDKVDGLAARARNVRRLHLTYATPQGNSICVELTHTARKLISRELFANAHQPDDGLKLSIDEKRALKQWLAARYGRPAFPDAFENRLRKKVKKHTVEQCVARILEPRSQHLVGVFFELGDARALDLDEGVPYVLRIAIVYDATEGGQDARIAAEETAQEVTALFREAYGPPEVAADLSLESCEAVADTHLSLADLRRVDQWRVEYISLRDDPPSDFIAAGEVPA